MESFAEAADRNEAGGPTEPAPIQAGVRSRELTGFSWAAFLFPWLWPFFHRLFWLGVAGVLVVVVPSLARFAILWRLVDLGQTPGTGTLLVLIALIAIEFGASLWIGFHAKRLFWAAHPDWMTSEAFVRRQRWWDLGAATWLAAVVIVFVMLPSPLWITSRVKLGPSIFGLSLLPGSDMFVDRPLGPDAVYEHAQRDAVLLPVGVHRVVLARGLSATRSFPHTLYVVSDSATDTSTVYAVAPTLWSRIENAGRKSSLDDVEELSWAQGRLGRESPVTIDVRLAGEISALEASIPPEPPGF